MVNELYKMHCTKFNTVYLLLLCTCMYNISICSINVNGLRNPVKRRQIFDSCNSQGVDILLLQETHAAGYVNKKTKWCEA